MSIKASFCKYTLSFKFDAVTSRGAMQIKDTWFVKVWDNNDHQVFGIGECGPLPKLSIDDRPDFEDKLRQFCVEIEAKQILSLSDLYLVDSIKEYPSIIFGLETALIDFANRGNRILFDTSFTQKQSSIPINGLIWMGKIDFMKSQIKDKIKEGYRCIKMKIGGEKFEDELALIAELRRQFSSEEIVIRLDANGAFKPIDALKKLEQLSKFDIDSIEQPIAAGQHEAMANLCNESPIDIALDEELIGIKTYEDKVTILKNIKPQHIILKPTLVGGFHSCNEWIDLAHSMNIGWWMTSALESNIGLNAIAQYTASKDINGIYQGLGTGKLYKNNIDSPLVILEGNLVFDNAKQWDLKSISSM